MSSNFTFVLNKTEICYHENCVKTHELHFQKIKSCAESKSRMNPISFSLPDLLHLPSFHFLEPIRLFVLIFIILAIIGFFLTLSLFVLLLCYCLCLCLQFLLHGKTSHGYDVSETIDQTQMIFQSTRQSEEFPVSHQKQRASEKLGEVVEYRSHRRTSSSAECIICLDEFVDEDECHVFPKCKHIFHAKCITSWLKIHLNCPICRSRLIETDAQSKNSTL